MIWNNGTTQIIYITLVNIHRGPSSVEGPADHEVIAGCKTWGGGGSEAIGAGGGGGGGGATGFGGV